MTRSHLAGRNLHLGSIGINKILCPCSIENIRDCYEILNRLMNHQAHLFFKKFHCANPIFGRLRLFFLKRPFAERVSLNFSGIAC